VKLRWGDLGKKNGKEVVGRGINWGFSSPHTLLPKEEKEEKEEKNTFCAIDIARRVPLNGSGPYFHEKFLSTWEKSI
jgi:hypothetical protein